MYKVTLLFFSILFIGNLNAQIIYTNIDDVVLGSDDISIDFNNDGVGEFIITNTGVFDMAPGINFAPQNAFVMLQQEAEIAGLALGTTVDANSNFMNNSSPDRWGYIDGAGAGLFPSGVDSYIGAVFNIGADTFYGWIKVNWDSANETFTVKEYAYQSTANTAINTGDTGTASIKELSQLNATVFPNPFVNQINIETPDNAIATLMDLSGKVILTKVIVSKSDIDLSLIDSGVYLLKINSDKGSITKKIIKK